MKDKKLVVSYYKRKLYRGRTAFARAVDFLSLRLIMLCAAYLWFSAAVESTLMAAVLAATAVITASVAAELVKSIRLERFIVKERRREAARLYREKLMQLEKSDFLALVRGYVTDHISSFAPDCLVCTVQSAAPVSCDDVLRAKRSICAKKASGAVIFSSSSVSEEARALASRLEGTDIRFVDADELTAHGEAASLFPTDEEVDIAVACTARSEREARKKSAARPFEGSRIRRYVFVACALFALSFFVEQSMYYRLLSAACLSFGAIAWWLNNTPQSGQAQHG